MDSNSTIVQTDNDCDGILNENDFDADDDNILGVDDCDDLNPESTIISEDLDCDGILDTVDEDVDGDGTIGEYDCDDTDPLSTIYHTAV